MSPISELAILRALAGDRTLGIAWWLFPDENHNTDGSHRQYLARQNEWKHYDPALFEALLKINNQNNRAVSALENPSILPNAVFASDPVPCEAQPFTVRPARRILWIEAVKARLAKCDLIFVDPDNGIAPPGLRLTSRVAGKSVTVEELKVLQRSGRTIIAYHHQTRFKGGHIAQISHLVSRLSRTGVPVSGVLRPRPWSPRLFLILNGD